MCLICLYLDAGIIILDGWIFAHIPFHKLMAQIRHFFPTLLSGLPGNTDRKTVDYGFAQIITCCGNFTANPNIFRRKRSPLYKREKIKDDFYLPTFDSARFKLQKSIGFQQEITSETTVYCEKNLRPLEEFIHTYRKISGVHWQTSDRTIAVHFNLVVQ